jgi:hypothetical protein
MVEDEAHYLHHEDGQTPHRRLRNLQHGPTTEHAIRSRDQFGLLQLSDGRSRSSIPPGSQYPTASTFGREGPGGSIPKPKTLVQSYLIVKLRTDSLISLPSVFLDLIHDVFTPVIPFPSLPPPSPVVFTSRHNAGVTIPWRQDVDGDLHLSSVCSGC